MPRRWVLLLLMITLPAAAQSPAPKTPPDGDKPKGLGLQFTPDGNDLLVRMLIEGPAEGQVVLTHYRIDDGRPRWDEPPIGVAKPRGTPRIYLHYLVIHNLEGPHFSDGGLMTPPTPEDVRKKHRHPVTWRLKNFKQHDFRHEDATYHIQAQGFEVWSDQLREALPQIQKTLTEMEKRRQNLKVPEGSKGSPAP